MEYALLAGGESRIVIAMIGPEKADRLKSAVPAGIELKFVRGDADTASCHQLVPLARALVIDGSYCRRGDTGPELIRLCAMASVPIIPFVSLSESAIEDVSAALHTMPLDILFDPADHLQRIAKAIGICTERRWPMLLAADLEPQLRRLPRKVALVTFATICGALAPTTVGDFHAMAGSSPSTNGRSFSSAGLGHPRQILVGARIAWALDSLRHSRRLTDVASRFGFGTSRSLRRALRQAAGISVADVREVAPQVVILHLGRWIRAG